MNVFSDIITNSISKLIEEEKGIRYPRISSAMQRLFFEKISKKKITGNEWKNVNFEKCS